MDAGGGAEIGQLCAVPLASRRPRRTVHFSRCAGAAGRKQPLRSLLLRAPAHTISLSLVDGCARSSSSLPPVSPIGLASPVRFALLRPLLSALCICTGVPLSRRQKVHSAPTPNLKEKYEGDLKKEIKKLQRFRDQIKSWAASNDIKNKKPLLDARKAIETEMERFKVLEKETKTKAYSKEGLNSSSRRGGGRGKGEGLDPREDPAKKDTFAWLDEIEEALQDQLREMDEKLEGLKASSKKKKSLSLDTQTEELQAKIDRHNFHIETINTIKDRLEHDELSIALVEDVHDSLEFYLSNNADQDFQEDLGMYDALELDREIERSESREEDAEEEAEGDQGGEEEAAEEEEAPEDEAAEEEEHQPLMKATPTKAKAGTSAASAATAASAASKQKTPASSPSASASATGPKGRSNSNASAASAAAAGPAPVVPTPTAAGGAGGKGDTLASIVMKNQKQAAAAAASAPSPAASPSPSASAAGGAADKKSAAAGAKASTGATAPAPSVNTASLDQFMADTKKATQKPSAAGANTPTSAAAAAAAAVQQPSAAAQPLKAAAPVIPSIAPAQLGRMPGAPGAGATAAGMKGAAASAGSGMMPPPGLLVSQTPPPGLGGLGTGVVGGHAGASGGVNAGSAADLSGLPSSHIGAGSSQLSAHKDRSLVSDDYLLNLSLLEPSLRNLPDPLDSDRVRQYIPRNPYRTPSYFPSLPAPIFDDPVLFDKLSVDSLFFIFYFQQGTPHQYLAARELKKQSWRYHKNFLTVSSSSSSEPRERA